jgi:hypothetical protein
MVTLSSPNSVVWEYFWSLRQLVSSAREAPSPQLSRQATALAVIMAVTVGEVFLNLWFRVRVEERHTKPQRDALLKDLAHPFLSLDGKLKQWPKRYLGQALDHSAGPGAAFMALKSIRNSIIHFARGTEGQVSNFSNNDCISDAGRLRRHGAAALGLLRDPVGGVLAVFV